MAAADRELELEFAERMGDLAASGGIGRMAGRVWAMLLVVDAPHLSSADLAERLSASAGAISEATRRLIALGIVERVRVPGERRDFFRARRGAFADIVDLRLQQLVAVELVVSEALEHFGDRRFAFPRLDEMHTVYHWYAREFSVLRDRFHAEQKTRAAEKEA